MNNGARLSRRYLLSSALLIVAALVVVGVFGFGYGSGHASSAATDATQRAGPGLDSSIGKPVAPGQLEQLQQLSRAPYGPSGAALLNDTERYGGPPLVADGKPLVVFIGADYCPYCAIQRWSVLLALMRFGNFSGLLYMTSNPAEGDLATFTFNQTTYASEYVSFRAFEVLDRNYQPLQTVPSNYSAVWGRYGSEFPFMDFGNGHVMPASMLRFDRLENENWSEVISGIGSGDVLGTQIRESANAITLLICGMTDDRPAAVCDQSPFDSPATSLTSTGSLVVGAVATPAEVPRPEVAAAFAEPSMAQGGPGPRSGFPAPTRG